MALPWAEISTAVAATAATATGAAVSRSARAVVRALFHNVRTTTVLVRKPDGSVTELSATAALTPEQFERLLRVVNADTSATGTEAHPGEPSSSSGPRTGERDGK
ncbi:hypothetical protein GCM10009760_18630 [Kitasatospora kazusensis]|uniref:Uncharacterized protein n=1 Tax=Kitasatospora kazusensis TaxID=407974 RepID=A0ABN2Z795_9ACTN